MSGKSNADNGKQNAEKFHRSENTKVTSQLLLIEIHDRTEVMFITATALIYCCTFFKCQHKLAGQCTKNKRNHNKTHTRRQFATAKIKKKNAGVNIDT